MSLEKFLRGLSLRFRQRRLAKFQALMPINTNWLVLDLGCGGSSESPWFPAQTKVIGLDWDLLGRERPYVDFVRADAATLPFESGAFELVFSNSLIEHLSSFREQQACAAEIGRVG